MVDLEQGKSRTILIENNFLSIFVAELSSKQNYTKKLNLSIIYLIGFT